ncbi:MAG: Gfo/Idh/MocA family oxidoreductase [Hyphomicrobiales bacterium]|nr:Gfo/Idh/MocA family oxidoreductase [Hyphomicrobiales bacterium]
MVDAVLVGCGAMSKAWLDAARRIDGLSIVGLVDLDLDRARARAAEFQLDGAATGVSLDAMLESRRPEVVFDVVVPAARASVARSAFVRGCHLLSEKPLAASLEDARAVVAAARKAGRLHVVVQNRRYHPGVRRIRRFLDSGVLGRPTSVHCDFFLAPHFGGFREQMEHVLLIDMAIHTFDAVRAMTGLEATSVHCREWDPPNSWYRQGASAAAIFDMGGGAVFAYRGSWCADGAPTSWEGSWRIVGEHGSLVWDGFDAIRAEAVEGDARGGLFAPTKPLEVPPLDPADRVGGHLGVMQDFIAAIRGGPPPETAGADNLKSLAMVFGAVKSAEAGLPVHIEA